MKIYEYTYENLQNTISALGFYILLKSGHYELFKEKYKYEGILKEILEHLKKELHSLYTSDEVMKEITYLAYLKEKLTYQMKSLGTLQKDDVDGIRDYRIDIEEGYIYQICLKEETFEHIQIACSTFFFLQDKFVEKYNLFEEDYGLVNFFNNYIYLGLLNEKNMKTLEICSKTIAKYYKIQNHQLFAIVGPSGVGKDALSSVLQLPKIISCTSREPRPGEDERSYHFLTKCFFKQYPEKFLEMVEYNEEYYGFLKEDIENILSESDAYVIVEWNGVKKFKELLGESQVTVIYIDAFPDAVEKRLRERGETEQKIKERMATYETFKTNSTNANYIFDNDEEDLLKAQREFREYFSWIIYWEGLAKQENKKAHLK